MSLLIDPTAETSGPSRGVRIALFIVYALLIVAHLPNIVVVGRLWAEEGIFYQDAWWMSPSRALLTEYGGYLNLVANAAGLIARYTVPLEQAPIVTTSIAFLFQLLPGLLILSSHALWLRSPFARAAALLALAAAPAVDEVWLQTLHSQYHLAICVALIIAMDANDRLWLRWLKRVVLALAPLSGLLAVLLTPLLVARAVVDRTRERVIQTAVLSLCAAAQVFLFYSPEHGAAIGRSSPEIATVIYTVFVRHLAVPFLGENLAANLGHWILVTLKSGSRPILPIVALVVLGTAIALYSIRRWKSGAPWLLAAALIVATVSYLRGISAGWDYFDPLYAQRYSYTPQVLLTCTLITLAATALTRPVKVILFAILVWITVMDVIGYANPLQPLHYGAGPNWRAEIREWRANPDHLIRLWPEGWLLQLTPDYSRPVRPVAPSQAVVEP